MKSFNKYIFNPRYVAEAQLEVSPRSVEFLQRLDGEDSVDEVVQLELELMSQYQPNLMKVGDLLTYHLRQKARLESGLADDEYLKDPDTLKDLHLMSRHVRTGLVLGALTCAQNFRQTGHLSVDYRDISSTNADLFEQDGLEVDMLLDNLLANTEQSTGRLRYMLGSWMELERPSETLEAATTLAAVAAYSLLDYQKRRAYSEHLEKTKDLAWSQYDETMRRNQESPGFTTPEHIRTLQSINCYLENQKVGYLDPEAD